jgi:hypothetical protein
MTDRTPNNAPRPEPLSPAAQAIVKAFDNRYELLGPLEDDWQEQCLAAALCAAADQVVPANGSRKNNEIRAELLTIATELDETNDPA